MEEKGIKAFRLDEIVSKANSDRKLRAVDNQLFKAKQNEKQEKSRRKRKSIDEEAFQLKEKESKAKSDIKLRAVDNQLFITK